MQNDNVFFLIVGSGTEYEKLKEKLARLYPEDRRNYTKHKQKYIDSVIEKAKELYLGNK